MNEVTQLAHRRSRPDLSHATLEDLVAEMLVRLGENPDREGLIRTPYRVARTWEFFTKGQHQNLDEIVNGAIFEEKCDEMVVVADINVFSQCEHHMLPFFGTCHVGYIPDGRLIGLSKIPRIVDVFCRRLQIQERLTKQVAEALQNILNPLGVGVIIDCQHMCMVMRGVEKVGSNTVTSAMFGCFRD
ncbi:MAG: GTP cyclohydrolase I FolE, partial [bacterium]